MIAIHSISSFAPSAKPLPAKALLAGNLSGVIYRAMGIPSNMYTVMFVLGRLPGWIAQWREMRLMNEPIGRPRQLYTGPSARKFKSKK